MPLTYWCFSFSKQFKDLSRYWHIDCWNSLMTLLHPGTNTYKSNPIHILIMYCHIWPSYCHIRTFYFRSTVNICLDIGHWVLKFLYVCSSTLVTYKIMIFLTIQIKHLVYTWSNYEYVYIHMCDIYIRCTLVNKVGTDCWNKTFVCLFKWQPSASCCCHSFKAFCWNARLPLASPNICSTDRKTPFFFRTLDTSCKALLGSITVQNTSVDTTASKELSENGISSAIPFCTPILYNIYYITYIV